MKKLTAFILTCIIGSTSVLAYEGEMGYFGGIVPGEKLPTTTELAAKKRSTSKVTLPYKETIYLTGKPVVVSGTIQFKPNEVDKEKGAGSYTETYTIRAEDAATESKVTRTVTIETKYIYDAVARQTTKTSEIKKWTEVVVVNGNTYQLDSKNSSFSKSILEDYTPGVTYYRGDVSYEAVYNDITGGENTLSVQVNGPIYGYEHNFAKTETQKRSVTVDTGLDQYYIEEMPTYTVYKELQYGSNEPDAISFDGNYKEVIRGEGSNTYNILAGHPGLYDNELVGSFNVIDAPKLEQLSIVSMPKLKGHPAESDIKKMYSLKIFTENPASFAAEKVVTRGEYIKMLVKALNITVPDVTEKKSSKKDVEEVIIFTDLNKTHELYPYALAAYNAGLIGSGRFGGSTMLTREEMVVLNVRAIGLQRLGIGTGDIMTPYIDDANISDWAKASVYAASKLGLAPQANNYFFPTRKVTYAEAAATMVQVLDYLRYDLQKDYNDKMMP